MANKTQPKKILFFRFDDCLGDSVVHSFFLRELKKLFPQATLTVATFAPSQQFFTHHPSVEHIIALPPLGPASSAHRCLRFGVIGGLLKMLWHNWAGEYDLTILNLTLSSRLHSFYCRLFSRAIVTKFDYTQHIISSYVSLLRELGATQVDTSYLFPLRPEDLRYAQDFLEKNSLISRPFWVLNPVGAIPRKQLSVSQLQFIAEKLRRAGFQTVLLDYKNQFADFPDKSVIRCTSKSVFETAAVLERAAGVVTTDTGIVHIADCFNKKLLVLYMVDRTGPHKRSFYASRNYPTHFIQSQNAVSSISLPEIDAQLDKILAAD